MADQRCSIDDERDSGPKDDLNNNLEDNRRSSNSSSDSSSDTSSESEDKEPFPTRQDVIERYQKVVDFDNKKIGLTYYMDPKSRYGLLHTFLAATSTPEYADEDRRKSKFTFAETTFISMVEQFVFAKTREIDHLAQGKPLKRRKLPDVYTFETFIGVTLRRKQYSPTLSPDPEQFKNLNILIIGLWNQAYEPDRERILSSNGLQPLGKALRNLHRSSSKGDSEPLAETWSVINWWLEPPDSKYIYKDAPLIPLTACWGYLWFMEARLRSSGNDLDAEKANVVKWWLSNCLNQTLEDVNQDPKDADQATEGVSKAPENVNEAPKDINQARREEGWRTLYLKSH